MSKMSRHGSFTSTEVLEKYCNLRADALQYPSRSAYLRGLVRADAITGADHLKALQIENLRPSVIEKIELAMLQQARDAMAGRIAEPLLEKIAAVENAVRMSIEAEIRSILPLVSRLSVA